MSFVKKRCLLDELTAITTIDGRYRDKTEVLAKEVSEMALIKTRFEVESRYLIALSNERVIRILTVMEEKTLSRLGPGLRKYEVKMVKQIETETKHDVKSVELVFRKLLSGTSMEDLVDKIHFGVTSEDINNLSYRLMFKRALDRVYLPVLFKLRDILTELAIQWLNIAILGRTHGQPATPTLLGKEIINFALRIHKLIMKLQMLVLEGKFSGFVGNYNEFLLSYPEIDWVTFSELFVKTFGFDHVLCSTQVNPNDDLVEAFQIIQRINNVLLGTDQDFWRYISDAWISQKPKKGEKGSSVGPQKINPINYENSEGNLLMANGTWDILVRKLQISRLQRDLSDSTVIRNFGLGLAFGLVAYISLTEGLGKIFPNLEIISRDLNANYSIFGGGLQTVLRRFGYKDPYSMVESFTKGRVVMKEDWISYISVLDIPEDFKNSLIELTPENYTGYAEYLTNTAIEKIKRES